MFPRALLAKMLFFFGEQTFDFCGELCEFIVILLDNFSTLSARSDENVGWIPPIATVAPTRASPRI